MVGAKKIDPDEVQELLAVSHLANTPLQIVRNSGRC
jgi:hypothetical protein